MGELVEQPGANLVGVSSTRLFRDIQTAAVLHEAAVGPVGVIKSEGTMALAVTGVLNGDGA